MTPQTATPAPTETPTQPPTKTSANTPDQGKTPVFMANDGGRAQRFVDRFYEDIRYVPERKQWMVWHETIWKIDDDGAVFRLALKHSRELLKKAVQIKDGDAQKKAVREALLMGDKGRIEPMIALARCDMRVIVRQAKLDADQFLLGVQNGVVELETGLFRPTRREDYITKQAGTRYESGADCPLWKNFLTEVLAGDKEVIQFLQKFAGYTLTGCIDEQCLVFLYGSGKNGKSTFLEVLQHLVGDYGQRASQDLIVAHPHGKEPKNDLAHLQGARMVVAPEINEGLRLAENRIKDLTGGDKVCGRFLYNEQFSFYPTLKLWLYGNHKPEIRGNDLGIWRRIHLVPFIVFIPKEKRVYALPRKLLAELPGILNWALEGVKMWRSEGLTAPEPVEAAVEQFREEEDILGQYLQDETTPKKGNRITVMAFYAHYSEWSKRTGQNYTLSSKEFYKKLTDRGISQRRTSKERFWADIALKNGS